jgi:hypothetical protein
MIEFAEVIKKPDDDEENQACIKPSHIEERDEKKSGERDRKRHRKPADQGSRFPMYLSFAGVIDQSYSGSKPPEGWQQKKRYPKRQEQRQERLIFT